MAANDQIHFTSYLRRIGDQVPEGLNPCPLLSGAIVTEDSMRSVCLFDVRDVDGHAVMVPDESAIFFAEPGTAITGVTRDLRFQKVQTSIHLDEQEFKRQIDQFISSDAPVRNHNLLRFMIQQALVELDITTNCAPDCIARDDNRAVIQLKSDKTVMFANFTRNAVGQFKLEIERF